ncbi:MAG TPA: hypothetical protein DHW02_20515 [Ktedonobacter sp.]|nr:hypothetical protein [Ktedonobacter sp.]
MEHTNFSNAILVLLGWLVVLAIFSSFIVLLRYLHHRERMALITQGIHPTPAQRLDSQRQRRRNHMLRAGLIIAMVGLALTIGLYPVGFLLPTQFASVPFHFGPWLLPGLIPLGVGTALIVSYYLEQPSQIPMEEQEPGDDDNITPLPLDKKRHPQ